MLYDISFTEKVIVPEDLEKSPYLRHLYNYYSGNRRKTLSKMESSIDNAISLLRPSPHSRLIWTKMGALLGSNYNTQCISAGDLHHLWDKVTDSYVKNADSLTFSHVDSSLLEEGLNKTIGTFLMWRISLREDHIWLAYKRDTDRVNHQGSPIRVTEYWVDDSYVSAEASKKAAPTVDSLEKLCKHFTKTKKTC